MWQNLVESFSSVHEQHVRHVAGLNITVSLHVSAHEQGMACCWHTMTCATKKAVLGCTQWVSCPSEHGHCAQQVSACDAQGLTRAGPIVEENNLTVGLWVHETLRVFYDRLINDEDRTWLTGLLSSMSYLLSSHRNVCINHFLSLMHSSVQHPNHSNFGAHNRDASVLLCTSNAPD